MTTTTTLAQINSKQSYTNQNNNGRGMMSRQMLPNLLINAAAPFAINLVAQHYMPTIDALLLASSVPAVYTLGSLVWKRRVNVLGLLVVASLLLNAVFALLFHSPRLLLLQSSVVNGLLGVAMLISLFFPRPVLFYLMRSITTQHDAQRIASFNSRWAYPQVRSFYRTLTMVWGCVTVAQVMLVGFLAFSLPISTMLAIGPILNFAIIIPAARWSIHYFRKNRSVFDQIRQQEASVA